MRTQGFQEQKQSMWSHEGIRKLSAVHSHLLLSLLSTYSTGPTAQLVCLWRVTLFHYQPHGSYEAPLAPWLQRWACGQVQPISTLHPLSPSFWFRDDHVTESRPLRLDHKYRIDSQNKAILLTNPLYLHFLSWSQPIISLHSSIL